MEIKDLVIGGRYFLPRKFEESKHIWAQKEVILQEVNHKGDAYFNLDIPWKDQGYDRQIPLDEIVKSKNFQRLSQEVYETIEKLRTEHYIYGYDGGPGGGGSGTIDLTNFKILPMIKNGQEGIQIPVDGISRFWTVQNIKTLFESGEVETSFKASEYTTIRTSLKLIKDKSKLPERSSWSTMRD